MLTIANNVKAKEFYKYGFKRPKYMRTLIKIVKKDRDFKNDVHYEIDLKTGEISVWSMRERIVLDNTLYDLIKAGLIIEKE